MFTRLGTLVLVVTVATVVPSSGGDDATRPRLCARSKVKMSGKAVGRMLRCHQRASLLGAAVDPVCVQAVGDQLVAGYRRASLNFAYRSESCLLEGGEEEARVDAESLAAGVAGSLRPVPDASYCAAAKIRAAGQAVAKQAAVRVDNEFSDFASALSDLRTRLENKLTRLDAKPDCLTSGDAASISGAVTDAATLLYERILGACGDGVKGYTSTPPAGIVGYWGPFHEQCDGTDAVACPGQCQPDCSCP